MVVQIPLNHISFTRQKSNSDYSCIPISETILNGFLTVDKKWTVISWNKAAEKLLGVLSEDIVGKNLWEKFTGIIPMDFYRVYDKAFLQNTPIHFREYWAEMGGWFDIIVYPASDMLSVSIKNCNQSVPVRMEEQLRALHELYKFVTEVTNDCLWEWDLQHKELFWIDGGHKRVFGFPIENTLVPQSFWESRLHPDDKERVLAGLHKIIIAKSGSLWEEDYRFERANGEYAYVHDRAHIIYEENKACRMIGSTQDVTARKLAEMQVLESERRLTMIARQTNNAIIITDAENKITWVNKAFTRITEYEPEEALGKKPAAFLQGRDTSATTAEYVKQKMKDKQSFNCDIVNYSKSGRKFWMHVQGQPLLDEWGNSERYFAIETDITEKILLENSLLEERLTKHREITEAVLIAQEKQRAEIGRELHDNVNQVLAMAKLYTQMAQKDETNSKLYLEESCRLLVSAIEELRQLAKTLIIPDQHMLFANIRNLINDVVRIHPIKIEFDVHGVEAEMLSEKLQLNIFRIVQEQITNILKHSKATRAKIGIRLNEMELKMVISDNGKGFDMAEHSLGIGIRNIMTRTELFNGKVHIASAAGKGFELSLVIPLPNPEPVALTASKNI